MFMDATAPHPQPLSQKARGESPSQSRRRRWLIRLGIVALLLWPAWKVADVFLAGNVHEVIPGRLYRGAQPSASSLESLVDKYKIRTVLNVRGCCWPDDWYVAEAAVCERLGVNLHDVCFSAVHLPSRHELRQLLEVLDHAEYPIFVHCRHGADRTGLTAMVAQLMLDEHSYNSAHRQLSMYYAHAPFGKTTMLDRFMRLYADWLTTTEQTHAPAQFRQWVLNEYRGGWCDARFEKDERLFKTPRVGQALEYQIVVRNTSSAAWQFRPLKTAGYHITFKVMNEPGNVIYEGRAGMLDTVVAPGEKIEVILTVPPITITGNYRLMVDMIEEGHCWFHQTGSEPWEEELVIRE